MNCKWRGHQLTFATYLAFYRNTWGIKIAWQVDALTCRLNRVEPSYIRVDADEVTYPAHVILRYRLEQAMMSGDLAVAELPGAWSDGLHAFLAFGPGMTLKAVCKTSIGSLA